MTLAQTHFPHSGVFAHLLPSSVTYAQAHFPHSGVLLLDYFPPCGDKGITSHFVEITRNFFPLSVTYTCIIIHLDTRHADACPADACLADAYLVDAYLVDAYLVDAYQSR